MGCDPSPRNPSTAEDQLRKTAAMENAPSKGSKTKKQPQDLKVRIKFDQVIASA
jgi:hypothetical protein